jgi:hypothetical protein
MSLQLIPCYGTGRFITREPPLDPVLTQRNVVLTFALGLLSFVVGLFSDAFNCSYCIASNDNTISDQRIGKDVEGSGRAVI